MARRGGFVLVLVLWVLLALTIAASALSAWVLRTTDQAVIMADEQRDRIDQASTLETLKYLFASHPVRAGGLYVGDDPRALAEQWWRNPFNAPRDGWSPDDLPLDGTLLAAPGNMKLRIQDEAGLVRLRYPPSGAVEAWLRRSGLSPVESRRRVEKLNEFIRSEPGSFRYSRVAADYQRANLPPPPGRQLLAPLEVMNVLTWELTDPPFDASQWTDAVTVLYRGAININSVPESLLPLMPDMSESQAQRFIKARAIAPINGGLRLPGRRGAALDPFTYTYLSGKLFRITLGSTLQGRALRYHVRLAPELDGGAPWRIELAYPVDLQTDGESTEPSTGQTIAHPLLAAPADSGRQSGR